MNFEEKLAQHLKVFQTPEFRGNWLTGTSQVVEVPLKNLRDVLLPGARVKITFKDAATVDPASSVWTNEYEIFTCMKSLQFVNFEYKGEEKDYEKQKLMIIFVEDFLFGFQEEYSILKNAFIFSEVCDRKEDPDPSYAMEVSRLVPGEKYPWVGVNGFNEDYFLNGGDASDVLEITIL